MLNLTSISKSSAYVRYLLIENDEKGILYQGSFSIDYINAKSKGKRPSSRNSNKTPAVREELLEKKPFL